MLAELEISVECGLTTFLFLRESHFNLVIIHGHYLECLPHIHQASANGDHQTEHMQDNSLRFYIHYIIVVLIMLLETLMGTNTESMHGELPSCAQCADFEIPLAANKICLETINIL